MKELVLRILPRYLASEQKLGYCYFPSSEISTAEYSVHGRCHRNQKDGASFMRHVSQSSDQLTQGLHRRTSVLPSLKPPILATAMALQGPINDRFALKEASPREAGSLPPSPATFRLYGSILLTKNWVARPCLQ